ncbi:hypothetical protein RFI_27433, partial [Reticulomyxa filosa]
KCHCTYVLWKSQNNIRPFFCQSFKAMMQMGVGNRSRDEVNISNTGMMNSDLLIFQNNINGFYSNSQILEQNLQYKQPHVCLLQEGFRSKKNGIDYNFQHLYVHHWIETGRSGVLCRRDLHSISRSFNTMADTFNVFGYESCWVEVSCPDQNRPLLFCSFYRNLQCKQSNIQAFEQELHHAMKISEHIVIGGDWNAHHPAWLDHNTDGVGDCILDFIVSNGLDIINTLPFNCTFMKDNATSSIDITLCTSSILPFVSNWRTNDVELDVHSDHLPITFNIKTTWSSPRIERQKIETWNLRSNKWEQFRLILKRNIDNWMQSIDSIVLNNTGTLDKAVESWTKCIVDAGEATIGIRTILKDNKPWWSDSLSRLRKIVQKSKNIFRKQRTPRNLMLYKKASEQLRRKSLLEKHQHMNWICEGVDNPRHVMPLVEAQSFEKIVMHSLTFSERKIICRLITVKVGLNDYLYNIQNHILLIVFECLKYQDLRRSWLLPDINVLSLSMKYFIIGNRTWKPDIRIKVVNAAKPEFVQVERAHCDSSKKTKTKNFLVFPSFNDLMLLIKYSCFSYIFCNRKEICRKKGTSENKFKRKSKRFSNYKDVIARSKHKNQVSKSRYSYRTKRNNIAELSSIVQAFVLSLKCPLNIFGIQKYHFHNCHALKSVHFFHFTVLN